MLANPASCRTIDGPGQGDISDATPITNSHIMSPSCDSLGPPGWRKLSPRCTPEKKHNNAPAQATAKCTTNTSAEPWSTSAAQASAASGIIAA